MTEKMNLLSYQTSIESPVAGITFDGRQKVAYAMAAANKAKKRCWLELRREAKNEFDSNAIAVIAHTNTMHARVGYLPAPMAAQLAPIVDAGGRLRIKSYGFVGGYRGRSLGMRLVIDVYA